MALRIGLDPLVQCEKLLPKHVYNVEIRRKNRVRNLGWKQSHTRDSNPGPSLGRPEARPPDQFNHLTRWNGIHRFCRNLASILMCALRTIGVSVCCP